MGMLLFLCIKIILQEIILVNRRLLYMKNKIKWFTNEDVFGYIEHKKNGDIIVCCSNKSTPDDYIRVELVKKGDIFELKQGLD